MSKDNVLGQTIKNVIFLLRTWVWNHKGPQTEKQKDMDNKVAVCNDWWNLRPEKGIKS